MPHRSTFQRWLARSRFSARLKAALIASGQWPVTCKTEPQQADVGKNVGKESYFQ
jgi:hypothetical protein